MNRYTNLQILGSGGAAVVYKAYDNRLKKDVSIKVFQKKELYDRELEIMQLLSHKGIPYIVDAFENDDLFYLVMEYLDGITLSEYYMKNKPLQDNEIINIMTELVDILDYMHSLNNPIMYLDLKPDNVIITKDGKVKLIDFGAACHLNSSEKDIKIYGTRNYASESMNNKNIVISPKDDIYALGMVGLFCKFGIVKKEEAYKMQLYKLNQYLFGAHLKKIIEKCIEQDSRGSFTCMKNVRIQLKNKRKGRIVSDIKEFILKVILYILVIIASYYVGMIISKINLYNLDKHIADIIMIVITLSVLLIYQKAICVYLDKGKVPYKQIAHIVVTNKKGVGLLSILIAIICVIGSTTYSKEIDQNTLDINVYDEYSRKILSKDSQTYYTNGDIYFEISKKNEIAKYYVSNNGGDWKLIGTKYIKILGGELEGKAEIIFKECSEEGMDLAQSKIILLSGEK